MTKLGVRESMRVGRTLPEGRAYPDRPAMFESAYHYPASIGTAPSSMPWITERVPLPYVTFVTESMEGSGGWTANAPGLLKFANRLFGRGGDAFFKPETMAQITARPSYLPANATSWYGIGWQLISVPAGLRIRFAGHLTGTHGEVWLFPNGASYSFITNPTTANDTAFNNDLANTLLATLSPLSAPGNDLWQTEKYTDGSIDEVPRVQPQLGIVETDSGLVGFADGGKVSIRGWNLAGVERVWVEAVDGGPAPTVLEGIEVKIDDQPAQILAISATRVDIIAPVLSKKGTAVLRVFRNGVASQPEPVEVR